MFIKQQIIHNPIIKNPFDQKNELQPFVKRNALETKKENVLCTLLVSQSQENRIFAMIIVQATGKHGYDEFSS